MKALIKRASLSILLIVFAPFAALADLMDAQRALLNGQFSEALEFAHDIADTHPFETQLKFPKFGGESGANESFSDDPVTVKSPSQSVCTCSIFSNPTRKISNFS